MSDDHTDPLWSTHATPMRSFVNRCESELRGEISTAFYLVKRGLCATMEEAMQEVGRYYSRPNLSALFNLGRNFTP